MSSIPPELIGESFPQSDSGPLYNGLPFHQAGCAKRYRLGMCRNTGSFWHAFSKEAQKGRPKPTFFQSSLVFESGVSSAMFRLSCLRARTCTSAPAPPWPGRSPARAQLPARRGRGTGPAPLARRSPPRGTPHIEPAPSGISLTAEVHFACPP